MERYANEDLLKKASCSAIYIFLRERGPRTAETYTQHDLRRKRVQTRTVLSILAWIIFAAFLAMVNS